MADQHNWTTLMLSSAAGHVDVDVARVPLEAGAEKNLTNNKTWTALMWAFEFGRVDAAFWLLEAGTEKHLPQTTLQGSRHPLRQTRSHLPFDNPGRRCSC